MAITFTEHTKTVNDALYDLINGEFTDINVRYCRDFEDEQLARSGEYIRFFFESDAFVDRHTDGEFRELCPVPVV